MRHIGSVEGIGAPLSPGRKGGDTFPRYIGDRLILDFREGAGTTVRDLSGNENNGTFGAGAAAPTWERNRLSFDGGDHIDHGNDSSFDIREEITVEAQVYPDGSGINIFLSKTFGSVPYILDIEAGNTARFGSYDGTWHKAVSPLTITTKRWYCFMGTHLKSLASDNLKLYQNGIFLDGEDYASDLSINTEVVYVGRYSNYYHTGDISFIRINATAFSAPQVLQEYLFNKWRN